ncbi:MAG: methionyl-tRNA formyltransferase [Candidatus Margulisiibacteriota bacterium]
MEFSTSIVFMGTPDFAVWTLKHLWNNKFPIEMVVTNPDRPAGRGMQLKPSPVKQWALKHDLPVIDDFDKFMDWLDQQTSKPANQQTSKPIIVIVAYGKILPARLVNNYTCINLHASLLPLYRGASPIQTCLLNGDDTTGVTTMLINEKMDAGDILLKKEIDIDENETVSKLHDRLAEAGADLLADTLRHLPDIKPVSQNDSEATYCRKIKKEDRLLDLSAGYEKVHNTVRAIGGYYFDGKKRISITRTMIKNTVGTTVVLSIDANDDTIKELIKLTEHLDLWVKPEGKKEMTIEDYLRGRRKDDS